MVSPTFTLEQGSLTDGVITLRELCEGDAVLYRSASDDDEINRRLGTLPDSPDALVEKALESWTNGSVATLVIVTPSGRAAGVVMVEPGHTSRANVGYWLLSEYKGSGYATRAVVLASRWAFRSLGIRRLQLFCEVDNASSLRVAERAGYRHEGTLRSYFQIEDERTDALVYSLLPSDGVS
ncbi:MAG: GNAT family protein [Acidimicrobiales bacterium]